MLLPGPTAVARMWAPYKLTPLIWAAVAAFALSGRLHFGKGGTIVCGVLVGVVLAVFLGMARKGESTKTAEIALGYTTVWMQAYKQPYLWYLHPKTKEVVSAPFEPRPANTRKAAMDAWMRERRSQSGPGPTSS